MEIVKVFIKTHLKKIIGGVILFIITFGLYGIFKLCKLKGES